MCTEVVHSFDTTTLHSQRAQPLPAVVGALPGKPYWTRVGTDSPRPLRQAWRGGAGRVPASPGAPHETGDGGGSHRGGGAGAPVGSHHLPSPLGGRSLHSDPCGKAEMLKTWTRVVLLNLALIAAGLRAWLSPWPAPGEVALPDLVGATDPLGQVTRPIVHQDTPALEQV